MSPDLFHNLNSWAVAVILTLPILFSSSCKNCPGKEKVPPFVSQEFNGRDEIISYGQMIRRPVYQAKVPINWKRIDPPLKETILDTTKPIVTFIINEHMTLTVHNFPTNCLDERIPVLTQIERWYSQLKAEKYHVENIEHGGFVGLYLEGKNDKETICAWSLQLDLEHYQTLYFLAGTVEEEEHYKQMRADLTIKVSSSTDLIEKHLNEIFLFANSFELIQEPT